MKSPIIIVGAGLSGLRAASLLTAQGIDCSILEARDRIGGRIFSSSIPNRPDLGKFDLGASWFWPQYEKTITNLANELNLKTFAQYIDGAMLSERSWNEPPDSFILPDNSNLKSARFSGGVQSLVEAIADRIPAGAIELETRVKAVRHNETGDVTVEAELADGSSKEFTAEAVLLALPPRMVARHIDFTPSLSSNLISNLINKPTWMAGQAKMVVSYERPFWREAGFSGFATSALGPLQEIHDASTDTGSYALFGFLGIPAQIREQLGKDKISEAVIEQLIRLFGPAANKINGILYKDWSEELETAVEDDLQPLRSYPNYGPPVITGNWEDKIIFAGTETNAQYGGHLEGALQSAEWAVAHVTNS